MYVHNMIDTLLIDQKDARQSGLGIWHSATTLDSWRPCDWIFDLVFGSLLFIPSPSRGEPPRRIVFITKKGLGHIEASSV